jgi:hypothetical protein
MKFLCRLFHAGKYKLGSDSFRANLMETR